MLNKKFILILLLLIVGICAISSASAADDISEIAATDDAQDDLSTDISEDENDIAAVSEEEVAKEADDGEKLSASEDDEIISTDQSNEKLGVIYYSTYTIDLDDSYEINAHASKKLSCYIKPCPTYMSLEGYHFTLQVFDKDFNMLYKSKEYKGDQTSTERRYSITMKANILNPGTYIMAAVNYDDNKIMDTCILMVGGDATITSSNYNANYMSSAPITVRVTDSANGKPLNALTVKAVFTNGKNTVTRTFIPNADGYVSFVPSLAAGTWSVAFSIAEDHISGASAYTAVIKKAAVSIKAKKVVEYKGFKAKLKAIVKSGGKKVKEGKVLFKINGKKYKVSVKNGVAVKKVKLKKLKKYKYSAKFLGTKNLFKTKKSKAKVTMKKRHGVKIYAPNYSVKVGQRKYFTIKVKTKSGKKVKNGWLKIQTKSGYFKVKVKNGKSEKLGVIGTVADTYVGGRGDDYYYKKVVTKKYKVKYIPGTHKYKKAKTKYKATTKFVCHCGKTYTHKHPYNVYAYIPTYYTIHVVK